MALGRPLAGNDETDERVVARQLLKALGVATGKIGSVLAVAQHAAGAAMSVDVSAGSCLIADGGTPAGQYHVCLQAGTTLAIAAADATNGRIDKVIIEPIAAGDNAFVYYPNVRVITGTPSGSPATPATPTGTLSIGTVTVDANAVSIVTAKIVNV